MPPVVSFRFEYLFSRGGKGWSFRCRGGDTETFPVRSRDQLGREENHEVPSFSASTSHVFSSYTHGVSISGFTLDLNIGIYLPPRILRVSVFYLSAGCPFRLIGLALNWFWVCLPFARLVCFWFETS